MFTTYRNFIIQKHRWVTISTLLIALLLSAGAAQLSILTDFRGFFSADNERLAALNNLEEQFNKQDSIIFYIEPGSNNVFNTNTLKLIEELTEQSWQIPYSLRVDSLANFQHISTIEDELIIENLYTDAGTLSPTDMHALSITAHASPELLSNIISADNSSTAVVITLNLPDNDSNAIKQPVEFSRQLAAKLQQKYPSTTVRLAGNAISNISLLEAVNSDLESLIPLGYLVLIAGLYFFLRTVIGTIVVLSLVSLSWMVTFGVSGWLGMSLAPTSGFVPTAVMAIAIADAVHLLSNYYQNLSVSDNKIEALQASLEINFSPIFITSFTTMVGVLCLNFSESPPYQTLGNMIAIGVIAAYLLSMSFLPALLAWLPIHHRGHSQKSSKLTTQAAHWVTRKNRLLLVIGSLVLLVCAIAIPNNKFSEQWHKYFDESFEIRQTVDAIDANLTGIHQLHFTLDSGEDSGVNNPAFLNATDNFVSWLKQQPKVTYVDSLSNTIKRLNKALHNNDPGYYRVPDSSALAAQYLLMYELSLPLGQGIDNVLSHDRRFTRVRVQIKHSDSEEIMALDQRARQWWQENASAYNGTEATGLDMMFADINSKNARSLFKGALFGLFIISILLIIALKSFQLGLISLFTNLAPATIAFGIWGFSNGKIDVAASVAVCISMGIVVDDTVHFLSKYQWARKTQGLQPQAAIHATFETVAPALIITSLVLIASFLVSTASHFSPSSTLGQLLALIIGTALLVDLLLLPPLLLLLDKNNIAKQ